MHTPCGHTHAPPPIPRVFAAAPGHKMLLDMPRYVNAAIREQFMGAAKSGQCGGLKKEKEKRK